MGTGVEYTDQLNQLMLAKVEILEQLCQLARQQSSITQTGDATILLSFLARKQPLMDRLTEVQARLSIYEHDDPRFACGATPTLRQSCRQVRALPEPPFRNRLARKAIAG